MKSAVVGGGVAGLAAAWTLRGRAEVTVFEPGRVGGCILTEKFDGHDVECGPDAFITRMPDALALCGELGIDDLVAPEVARPLLWWDGRLQAIPAGLVLGAPTHVLPLVTSRLLTLRGVVRAAGDLVLPRQPLAADVSVYELVERRFGAQVAERLVDPLVGSIHAGSTRELSAAATVAPLWQASLQSRSVLLGLRRSTDGRPSAPAFMAPRRGLGHLVTRLSERLERDGVKFDQLRVRGLKRDGNRWRVEPAGESFDTVVVATSAGDAYRILGAEAPLNLRRIAAASVAVVTIGVPRLDLPPGASGVLVPRSSGFLSTACSFASAKWPHWARPDRTVLRISVGRARDDRAFALDDAELVDRVVGELSSMIGRRIEGPPLWRVNRWPGSMPQYRVGHTTLVAAAVEELGRSHPNVTICGSSYFGSGIPACMASGASAARTLQAHAETNRR